MPLMALYMPGQQKAIMLVWKIWNHAFVWMRNDCQQGIVMRSWSHD
jgi:hypothetical protein